MIKSSHHSSISSSTTNDLEFVKVELEQALETFRTQLSLLVQIVTILVIADATVVGFAVSTQIAGILLIGPLFPIMIIVITSIVFRLAKPVVYTAVSLEHKYGDRSAAWLASTFLSSTVSTEYVAQLKEISSVQDSAERMRRLRSVPAPSFGGTDVRVTRVALIVIAVGQVIAPVVLSLCFGWRLF